MTDLPNHLLDEEFGTDDELAAECRMLGSLMLEPSLYEARLGTLKPIAFCAAFHAAIYREVLALIDHGLTPDPVSVWFQVQHHEDAAAFGPAHVAGLVAEAEPENYYRDALVISARGVRRTNAHNGKLH